MIWLFGRGGEKLKYEICRQDAGSGYLLVMTEPDLGPDALALLEPGTAVGRRTTPGGAGPGPVAEQLVAAAERLAQQARLLS